MGYRRRLKYYLLKVFRLSDSPRDVAGGFAWGTFVHFYPTCGLGAFFAVMLARLFRTNLAAATLGWAVTAPLFPVFFYLNLISGEALLGEKQGAAIAWAITGSIRPEGILFLGKAFFLGSVVNSILATFVLWWLGYLALKKYRQGALQTIIRLF